MNHIHYKLILDMFETVSQKTIKAKKGDTACSVHITLTERGKIYQIPDGCRATFSAKKADGNFLYNEETCRIEDNTIVYDFTKQTTACEGNVECEVILYKGDKQLTAPCFTLFVDGVVYNGEEIISSPEADALKDLVEDANKAFSDLTEQMGNLCGALRQSKSGEIFQITDASPLPHLATVTVEGADQAYVTGRNLFDGVYEDVIMGGAVNTGYARKTLDFLPAGRYMFSFSPSIHWQSPRGEGYGITTVTSSTTFADDGGILSIVVDITDPSIALIQFRCKDANTYPVPKDVVRMQIEFGETLTEYTPYVEPIVVPSGGSVQLPQGVATVYAKDAVVTCEYNRDINAAFHELTQAIINLGGNV